MPNGVFRRLLVLGPLLVLAAGCAGGAASGDLDKLQVTMGRFDITVVNTSGRALKEVVAEIEPIGPGSPFIARPDTLASGEERHLAHTSFMDRDSVPFSPRNKRAARVTVTAKDLDGKAVRVIVPFKS